MLNCSLGRTDLALQLFKFRLLRRQTGLSRFNGPSFGLQAFAALVGRIKRSVQLGLVDDVRGLVASRKELGGACLLSEPRGSSSHHCYITAGAAVCGAAADGLGQSPSLRAFHLALLDEGLDFLRLSLAEVAREDVTLLVENRLVLLKPHAAEHRLDRLLHTLSGHGDEGADPKRGGNLL